MTPEEEARAQITAEKLADGFGAAGGCVGGCLLWGLILFVGVPAVILAAVGISNVSHPGIGVGVVLAVLAGLAAAWLYRKELGQRKDKAREEWHERQGDDKRLW